MSMATDPTMTHAAPTFVPAFQMRLRHHRSMSCKIIMLCRHAIHHHSKVTMHYQHWWLTTPIRSKCIPTRMLLSEHLLLLLMHRRSWSMFGMSDGAYTNMHEIRQSTRPTCTLYQSWHLRLATSPYSHRPPPPLKLKVLCPIKGIWYYDGEGPALQHANSETFRRSIVLH